MLSSHAHHLSQTSEELRSPLRGPGLSALSLPNPHVEGKLGRDVLRRSLETQNWALAQQRVSETEARGFWDNPDAAQASARVEPQRGMRRAPRSPGTTRPRLVAERASRFLPGTVQHAFQACAHRASNRDLLLPGVDRASRRLAMLAQAISSTTTTALRRTHTAGRALSTNLSRSDMRRSFA